MKKIKIVVIGLAIIIFILYSIGSSIQECSAPPDGAYLFIKNDKYISPPCLMNEGYDDVTKIIQFADKNDLLLLKNKEIGFEKYSPDSECRSNDGYNYCESNLSRNFLERIGLVSEKQPRWNEDGSWNF